jgi:hypothetical protein
MLKLISILFALGACVDDSLPSCVDIGCPATMPITCTRDGRCSCPVGSDFEPCTRPEMHIAHDAGVDH